MATAMEPRYTAAHRETSAELQNTSAAFRPRQQWNSAYTCTFSVARIRKTWLNARE